MATNPSDAEAHPSVVVKTHPSVVVMVPSRPKPQDANQSEKDRLSKLMEQAVRQVSKNARREDKAENRNLLKALQQAATVTRQILRVAPDPIAAGKELTDYVNYRRYGSTNYRYTSLVTREPANEYEGRYSLSFHNKRVVADAFARVDKLDK